MKGLEQLAVAQLSNVQCINMASALAWLVTWPSRQGSGLGK